MLHTADEFEIARDSSHLNLECLPLGLLSFSGAGEIDSEFEKDIDR